MDFERLQNIDRRWLYLLLLLAVAVPMLRAGGAGGTVVLPETRNYYETVERVAADPVRREKLVILVANFSSSTATENLTQYEATMRHLMSKRLKFAILSLADPQGRELAQQAADRLSPEFDYQYGRDYVNWGFKTGDAALNVKALARDIPGTFGKDIKGTPLEQIPVMRGVRGVNDVGLVVETASVDSLEYWLAYFRAAGDEPVPLLYACTAVMAVEAYPFLRSGQVQGMLNGLTGAGQYEALLNNPGFGSRMSTSLSWAHFLILFLIVFGNVAMVAARRRAIARGAV